MMTQRVHSRLHTKTKAFFLISQTMLEFFFSFFASTLLILACLKLLGIQCRKSHVCVFFRCLLPSQTRMFLILALKKKKSTELNHGTSICLVLSMVEGKKKQEVQFTGLIETITLMTGIVFLPDKCRGLCAGLMRTDCVPC